MMILPLDALYIPKVVLQVIWKVSQLEADDTASILWGHGLVTYSSSVIPCFGIQQRHIDIHAIISQFIIETIQSEEVIQLTPYVNLNSGAPIFVVPAVYEEFHRCYGLPDLASLSEQAYLKYRLSSLEYFAIPYQLRYANMWAFSDPHIINYTIYGPCLKCTQQSVVTILA